MTDRVALITGAGSGLGRATAIVLARKGTRCVLAGRREAAIQSAADEIVASGGTALPVVTDITVPADRGRIVERCVTAFGRLDVLVNNAGISHQAPLLAATPEDWRTVMATNLDAMFFLAQAALPTMRAQKFGRIINIGSVYGSLGMNAQLYGTMLAAETPHGPTRQVGYHTSKGGVLNLTRDLAIAVAPWGVTVNCISPGMFLTEQSKAVVDPDVIAALARMTPAGRFGDPPEIGHAVAFLASEEAAFITGVDLKVDGGWSIW
jgi:NAD(P)-dependent dehydrogenase (short-subunit alcohol dehydrogenase family)